VDHIIRAAKILLERGVDVRLAIVGTGETEKSLHELADSLGVANKIKFTGRLHEPEKNDQLQRAHFLVHTSVREGWGLNVIEANALGTPAIVYPVGGLVDSTVDNETGLVTRNESPEAVADTIESLLRAPEKYDLLRKNAWQRSRQLTWPEVLPTACAWLEAQATGKN
jgi:glycosyltransferase involved in cell wall biosynthesis